MDRVSHLLCVLGPGSGRCSGIPKHDFAATSHHNSNVLVTFEDADRASVRTSVYAWHQRADGRTPRLWRYYHDSVVRLPEEWRIAQRRASLSLRRAHRHGRSRDPVRVSPPRGALETLERQRRRQRRALLRRSWRSDSDSRPSPLWGTIGNVPTARAAPGPAQA